MKTWLVIDRKTGLPVMVIDEKSGVDRESPVWTARYEFREIPNGPKNLLVT